MEKNLSIGDWVRISGFDSGGKDIDGCVGKYTGLCQTGCVSVFLGERQTSFAQRVFYVKPSQIKRISGRDEPPPFSD